MVKKDDRLATFKVEGQMGGRPTLSGRLVLERYNLADSDPHTARSTNNLNNTSAGCRSCLLPARLAAAAG